MHWFPPPDIISKGIAPLSSRPTQNKSPLCSDCPGLWEGQVLLLFPAADICFISVRGFNESISQKALSHKNPACSLLLSLRRKKDLLTQSLCLLAFKCAESGNICLHTTPALLKSHFQVICSGALFQSTFGLIILGGGVGRT